MDTINRHTEVMAIDYGNRLRSSIQNENSQQQPSGILDINGLHVRGRGLHLNFEQLPGYVAWAANLLGIECDYFGECTTIAVGGSRPTVVVYSRFNGINCEVTVAATGTGWLRKQILSVLLAYPFRQLGCRRITLLISDTNQRTQKAARRVGFTHEGYLREFMKNGEGCHIYSLTKTEYEESKYGLI